MNIKMWDKDTTYNKNELVLSGNFIYRCTVDGTKGYFPFISNVSGGGFRITGGSRDYKTNGNKWSRSLKTT